MTDKLRQRARELAEGAAGQVLNDLPAHQRLIGLIEAAILAGMREALREEPDKEMVRIGGSAAFGDTTGAHLAFNAMGDYRARGLE